MTGASVGCARECGFVIDTKAADQGGLLVFSRDDNESIQPAGGTRRVGPQSASPRGAILVNGVEMQHAFDLCGDYRKGCLRL
jgi:hypothetical protein